MRMGKYWKLGCDPPNLNCNVVAYSIHYGILSIIDNNEKDIAGFLT